MKYFSFLLTLLLALNIYAEDFKVAENSEISNELKSLSTRLVEVEKLCQKLSQDNEKLRAEAKFNEEFRVSVVEELELIRSDLAEELRIFANIYDVNLETFRVAMVEDLENFKEFDQKMYQSVSVLKEKFVELGKHFRDVYFLISKMIPSTGLDPAVEEDLKKQIKELIKKHPN